LQLHAKPLNYVQQFSPKRAKYTMKTVKSVLLLYTVYWNVLPRNHTILLKNKR